MFDDGETIFARDFFKWGLVFILFIIVATTMIYMMKPTWLGMEREAAQESHQYVESKRERLLTNAEQYEKLGVDVAKLQATEGNEQVVEGLKRQQRALLSRMKTDAQLIPKSEVPASVKALIQGN